MNTQNTTTTPRHAVVTLCAAAIFSAHIGAASAASNGPLRAVARIMIYPGDIISTEMIDEAPNTSRQIDQAFATREQVVGKVSRRTLVPGQPIPLSSLREPNIVQSGRPVAIVFSSNALTITGKGVALQSGASGDVIAVQNSETSIVVRGQVQPDGTVRLDE